MRARDKARNKARKQVQSAERAEVRKWEGLPDLSARTNWQKDVEAVCYLGSSAQRLTDESAESFNARCKAHKEAGKNPNRLRPLKATGVTTWERNRDNQRRQREYHNDLKTARVPRPYSAPTKAVKVRAGHITGTDSKGRPIATQSYSVTVKERTPDAFRRPGDWYAAT
jgi:hypothetical protein